METKIPVTETKINKNKNKIQKAYSSNLVKQRQKSQQKSKQKHDSNHDLHPAKSENQIGSSPHYGIKKTKASKHSPEA